MFRKLSTLNREFLVLIGGQSLSSLGTAITNFALPWLLLQVTGSALQMGIGFAIETIPYLVLSIPAGVWADRYNRKRLMMRMDALRLIIIVSLPVIHLFSSIQVFEIYGVLVLMSASSAVFDASYGAALPLVMGKDFLKEGNVLRSVGTSTARVLGPAIGGALVVWLGATNTLNVDAGSYLASLISLAVIRKPFSEGVAGQRLSSRFLVEAREGMRYLFGHPLIRKLVLLASIINLWGEAVFSVLLYHMRSELHIGATWSGVVMTFVGVGILIGSLSSLWIMNHTPVVTSITGLLILQVAMPATLSFTAYPALIALCVLVYASTSGIWSVLSSVIRQSVVPNQLLGRVGSANRLFSWIAMPVGSASGGAIAQEFGAWNVFRGSSILQVLMIGWWALGLKQVSSNEKSDSPKARG
ncbi:MFS transporter [Alicyclobacillus sp. ALC3]|uniref:MFS transporter n=1 Tax=Alicyclobacillus sp. ALC3 TaxID=2796143 RepID=UPI002379B1BA|nr:MFS transporter [Alicyclobacillus sp. ALC3]WDL96728.1 MFS transporter [Alicyclobacillus sp. ALC3]